MHGPANSIVSSLWRAQHVFRRFYLFLFAFPAGYVFLTYRGSQFISFILSSLVLFYVLRTAYTRKANINCLAILKGFVVYSYHVR